MNLDRLYFLREEKDLTQQDLAKILKVNRVAISQWETGKEVISLLNINIFLMFHLGFLYSFLLSYFN